ncbi:hypothetical protein L2E82_21413 [Cichorium intybus]|uniref:Uncharacterized protein n=1 Tax=Cichorium intybus TaxID=13427 RepID=A0ACB9DVV4_CICIN|nr:hypothetical protein L2E82_21413 [Cichorium intybus]
MSTIYYVSTLQVISSYFQVLLGEGYYADRTSKQTIEILKRRGNDLESQFEALNAVIKDLKFEASFCDETATKAAEGVVEIREDYVDESFNEDEATPGEDEYARILSGIDELEKEEMESEMAEEGEEEEEYKADLSHLLSRTCIEPEVKSSEEQIVNEHPVSKTSVQKDAQQNLQPKDTDVDDPHTFTYVYVSSSDPILVISALGDELPKATWLVSKIGRLTAGVKYDPQFEQLGNGIPNRVFSVLFAIPRMAGYLSHWREFLNDPDTKIMRPAQVID